MPNRRRGEITAVLDGRTWTLVLTLGALAELEDAFSCEDLPALLVRFGKGRLAARDMIRILGAGLRGAGNEVKDEQVAMMRTPLGAAGFAAIAADLLSVTFGGADDEQSDKRQTGQSVQDLNEEAGQDDQPPFAPLHDPDFHGRN